MSDLLPVILQPSQLSCVPFLVDHELALLQEARKLYDANFPSHALLNIWNAAIHNLRRRIEMYSVEIFLSTVKDESGRKKYDKDGEAIQERWSSVDDAVLISGATRLSLLNKKAGKALEMINWMRNHASPAHDSLTQVASSDVIALALLLQKNLFEDGVPDPGHSPAGLFDPIKRTILDTDKIYLLTDQIKSYRQADIRIAFGFLLDLIVSGEDPGHINARNLFRSVWIRATEDLKGNAGFRYQSLILTSAPDENSNNDAKTRLLETLVSVDGITYIPDGARATLFRRAAALLASAKNTSYGWKEEESAAKTFKQFGVCIPSICFEECYQEILSVWCGNFWGRSQAFIHLRSFIFDTTTTQLLSIARLFESNERVQSELSQGKPKAAAKQLLIEMKAKLTIASHQGEIDRIILAVDQL